MTRWPNGSKTTKPRVSSKYGRRIGGAFSFHYGCDFTGYTDLRNIEDGKVTHAGWLTAAAGNAIAVDLNERGPLGETITIVRMHASAVQALVGRPAAENADLGNMGATGNATGLCDHVEIRYWKDGGYKTVDPEQWIAARIAAENRPATAPNATKWPARSMYGAAHVVAGQKLLIKLGYNLGVTRADGYDGALTQAAVLAVQKKHGLNPDKVLGPITLAKLKALTAPKIVKPIVAPNRPTIRRGSKGRHVKDLQKRLAANYPAYARGLRADGDFGPATERVVREFQRRAGLFVDGVVGPKTWARLGF